MPTRTPRFRLTTEVTPVIQLRGGYGHEWRKLRNQRIAAEPLCRGCAAQNLVTIAVEVDHIIPRALGGRDEWENTQSLCKACHQDKTRQDIARMPR